MQGDAGSDNPSPWKLWRKSADIRAVDGCPPPLYNPPPIEIQTFQSRYCSMAHHKSAEKRIRQTVVSTARNRANTSRMKSAVKKAEEAIAAGNKTAAEAALKAA